MRKLAVGAWSKPSDPSVHAQFDFKINKVDAYIKSLGDDITLKHFIIKALSRVIYDVPQLNQVMIRKKIRQRMSQRIFIPVVFRNRRQVDLHGISLDDVYQLPLIKLSRLMKDKINEVRSMSNPKDRKVFFLFRNLPFFLARPFIRLIDFIQYTLNINLELFGFPNDSFGSMTVTFLDAFNVRYVHVPIFPFSRYPVIISVGKEYENGKDLFLPMCITFDHRYFDGLEGGKALKRLRYYLNHPEQVDT